MFSRLRRSSRSVRFEDQGDGTATSSSANAVPNGSERRKGVSSQEGQFDEKTPTGSSLPPQTPLRRSGSVDKRIADKEAAQLMRRPSLVRRLSNTFLRLKSSGSSSKLLFDENEIGNTETWVLSWGRNDYGQLMRTMPDPLKEEAADEAKIAHDENGNPIDELDERFKSLQLSEFDSSISEVSVGLFHTVASSSRGVIWGAGDNEDGQLDIGKSPGHFAHVKSVQGVDALAEKVPSSISTGLKHTAIVTRDGLVLTWGSNDSGQLGHSKGKGSGPRQLDGNVRRERSVQVACTEGATFILTEKGQVWSTGEGTRGELGRPETLETGCSWMASPVLGRLFCTPISLIATGSAHVVALTVTGKAFGWGWNKYGQLGFAPPATGNRFESSPVAIASNFHNHNFTGAACGTNHTVLLAPDELVITAGANDFGQLGRSSETNHSFDQVTTLRGKGIVKVACGSYHTICLSNNGSVWGFGSNEFGEVIPPSQSAMDEGTVVVNVLEPKECLPESSHAVDIYAGGRCSFVVIAKHANDFNDLLKWRMKTKPKLYGLDAKLLKNLCIEATEKETLAGLKGALMEFHATGLNRSFLTNHTESRVDVEGVLASLQLVWNELNTRKDGIKLMRQKFEQLHKELLDLAAVATEPDQIRAFFIALLNPACESMQSQVYLILVKALATLKDEALNMIASWSVADCSKEVFSSRLLKNLLRVIDFAAERRDWSSQGCAPAALRVLSKLREFANQVGEDFVAFDKYYVSQPKRWANHVLIDEWRRYLRRDRNTRPTSNSDREFSLFDHPFVISAETKRSVMMFDQQSSQLHNAVVTALANSGSPFFEINVRRDHLLEDAFSALLTARRDDLTKPLRVTFEGEPGLDWGGVAKEFFELLSSTLFDPKERDMFYTPDSDRPSFLWLNARGETARLLSRMDDLLDRRAQRLARGGTRPFIQNVFLADAVHCPRRCPDGMTLRTLEIATCICDVCLVALPDGCQAYSCRKCNYDVCVDCRTEDIPEVTGAYRQVAVVGMLIGLSVYHSILIDVQFPHVFYSALLDKPITNPTLHDLATIDPSLARGLKAMLDFPEDKELFAETFGDQTFYVEDLDVELIPGGKDISLNLKNRELYVKRRCEFEVYEGVSRLFAALMTGFRAVVDVRGDAMSLFSPPELELMVVGVPELDFKALSDGAKYEGYESNSQIVKWFWQICFEELSLEQQRQLLHFVTGSGKAPVGGLANQIVLIQRAGPDSEQLPTAHTCFNTLLLPEYISKEKLREKLLIALKNAEGFGLQ